MVKKDFLKYLLLLVAVVLISSVLVDPVQAADQESFYGDPLCLPGVYGYDQTDCLVMGPAEFLTSMNQKGVSLPFQPLPAYTPDYSYNLAPVPYMVVGENSFPVYASLDDAVAGNVARYLEAGFKYLAVYQRLDRDDGIFYQLANGLWVNAGEAHTECCIRSGRFQGLMFYQNPANSFGWVLDIIDVHKEPGAQSALTGKKLYREDVVQIYDTVTVGGSEWYMIGIDEWVDRFKVRQFHVNTTPPEGVDNNRWIELNLEEQTLGVYENGKLVFAALISTGIDPFFTQPGLFKIYEKLDKTNMSGSFESDRSDYYYLEEVPWTLYYDEARAIHGAYWHTYFGYPQSHGCVNLTLGDARVVYDWANVGDWVYVWDPSGKTPTDPSLYTAGGA
jgi:hypothetical protein